MTDLTDVAYRIRRTVLQMCRGRGQGYAGQGLALADVLAHLYFRAMRPGLDRFVLSTGHSAVGLFAALGERGDYTPEELAGYGTDGSRIEESPLDGTPGFEITGGSLGQGVSMAIGLALGERLAGRDSTVYCEVSDGELQEGQVWEAAMSAGHFGLGNLVLLVDNNDMQADGATSAVMPVEDVVAKFQAFGWTAQRVDPHDHEAIARWLPIGGEHTAKPRAFVCDTVPGKGVPSFETYQRVHYIRAADDAWARALAELDER